MFHPTKGNLDSGMRKIFAIEIQNPTIFSVESGIIGFGIRNTAQEILNPTHDKNPAESSTSSAKSKLWNHELKTVFDSLALGEIFILFLFIHQVSSPLCCEHHLLEVNTTCQIMQLLFSFVLSDKQTLLSINAPANA